MPLAFTNETEDGSILSLTTGERDGLGVVDNGTIIYNNTLHALQSYINGTWESIAEAGDTATNTANIATNVTNIATNVTDIATNTSNIATNVTNIATNTAQENAPYLLCYKNTIQTLSADVWAPLIDFTVDQSRGSWTVPGASDNWFYAPSTGWYQWNWSVNRQLSTNNMATTVGSSTTFTTSNHVYGLSEVGAGARFIASSALVHMVANTKYYLHVKTTDAGDIPTGTSNFHQIKVQIVRVAG